MPREEAVMAGLHMTETMGPCERLKFERDLDILETYHLDIMGGNVTSQPGPESTFSQNTSCNLDFFQVRPTR